jgi:hypothetical protein
MYPRPILHPQILPVNRPDRQTRHSESASPSYRTSPSLSRPLGDTFFFGLGARYLPSLQFTIICHHLGVRHLRFLTSLSWILHLGLVAFALGSSRVEHLQSLRSLAVTIHSLHILTYPLAGHGFKGALLGSSFCS